MNILSKRAFQTLGPAACRPEIMKSSTSSIANRPPAVGNTSVDSSKHSSASTSHAYSQLQTAMVRDFIARSHASRHIRTASKQPDSLGRRHLSRDTISNLPFATIDITAYIRHDMPRRAASCCVASGENRTSCTAASNPVLSYPNQSNHSQLNNTTTRDRSNYSPPLPPLNTRTSCPRTAFPLRVHACGYILFSPLVVCVSLGYLGWLTYMMRHVQQRCLSVCRCTVYVGPNMESKQSWPAR